MGTQSRMNVEITGSVDGLTTAMATANETVGRAASQMRTQTEEMGGMFEGMAHRFEHSGVMIAFAVNNMMDGSQKGVDRALHSIALLGFAFGTVVGSITTATALIAEQIKDMVEKSSKQLDEFNKKLDEFVNKGNVAALMKEREELLTGSPSKDGKLVGQSDLVKGAFKGSLEDLDAQLAATNQTMGTTERQLYLITHLATATPYEKLAAAVKEAHDKLEALDARIAAGSAQRERLMAGGDLPKVTVSVKSGTRTKADADKEAREALELQLAFNRMFDKNDEEFDKEKNKRLDEGLAAAHKATVKAQEENASTIKQGNEVALNAQHQLATEMAGGMKGIQKTTSDAAQLSAESWMKAFQGIQGSFEKAFDQMKQHGGSFAMFMRKVGQDMLGEFVRNELRMLEAHTAVAISKQAIDADSAAKSKTIALADALTKIAANAATAAAGAYSAMASIPYVGPVVGAIAAGVTYAGVMAFGALASAQEGFDVPAGLNPITQLHAQEMVLPAHLANAVRGMAANGGGGGGEMHYHFHTNDALSTAAWARQHTRELGEAAARHIRGGGGVPASAAGRRA